MKNNNAIIFTGSRDWLDKEKVEKVLKAWSETSSELIVIHGDARGLDTLAETSAKELGITTIPMPAQWKKYGKKAGTARNKDMLELLLCLKRCGYNVFVEAFSLEHSIGTKHMMAIAEKSKVPIREHKAETTKKIQRNMSTPESREFWEHAEKTAKEVEDWPEWKKAK